MEAEKEKNGNTKPGMTERHGLSFLFNEFAE